MSVHSGRGNGILASLYARMGDLLIVEGISRTHVSNTLHHLTGDPG